jgi:MerR family transcriptional regulator, copper efflux regulator
MVTLPNTETFRRMLMRRMTIGCVARATGVSIDTIRFYERIGLVSPQARTDGGYRVFDAEAVERIRFIQQAKDLGFSLKEVGDLLALNDSPGTSCADVRARTVSKIAQIDERIGSLQRIREALVRLSETCPGTGPVARCTILNAMRSDRLQ